MDSPNLQRHQKLKMHGLYKAVKQIRFGVQDRGSPLSGHQLREEISNTHYKTVMA